MVVDFVAHEYAMPWRELWRTWTLGQVLALLQARIDFAKAGRGGKRREPGTLEDSDVMKSDWTRG